MRDRASTHRFGLEDGVAEVEQRGALVNRFVHLLLELDPLLGRQQLDHLHHRRVLYTHQQAIETYFTLRLPHLTQLDIERLVLLLRLGLFLGFALLLSLLGGLALFAALGASLLDLLVSELLAVFRLRLLFLFFLFLLLGWRCLLLLHNVSIYSCVECTLSVRPPLQRPARGAAAKR